MLQPFTLLSILFAAGTTTTAPSIPALTEQVADAARAAVLTSAKSFGLADASVELSVLPARGAPLHCAGTPEIAAEDIRQPARMRFSVTCPTNGWRGDFIVRGTLEATVVITAAALQANRAITADDLQQQRRRIGIPAEALADPAAIIGMASRRALRAGQPVDRKLLVEAQLIRRGDAVQIVARNAGIVATMPGEAQATGHRGEVIGVRNTHTGKIIRARVVASGEVEPIDAAMP